MSQKNKLNFVAEAQIWKDHLETEHEAVRKWPKRWGFLLTPVQELIKDEKKELAKPKILLPEHLQIRPVTPVEKYIKETSTGSKVILRDTPGPRGLGSRSDDNQFYRSGQDPAWKISVGKKLLNSVTSLVL